MHLRLAIAVLMLPMLCACRGDQGDPKLVAEQFWVAARAGDTERARQYMLESSTAELKGPDEGEEGMGEVTVGDVTIDGDEAMVATRLTTGGEQSMEVSFSTVLVREAGEWKVDFDRTSDAMMKSMFGVTMSEMGEAIGEAMGKAMEGMVEGLAEGLQAIGESAAAARDTASDTTEHKEH